MASFRERDGQHQAIVRKRGYERVAKTFQTKAAARSWATQVEAAMDNGSWTDVRGLRSITVGSIVERYIQEMNQGATTFGKSKLATVRLTAREFADVPVSDLIPERILEYGRARREHVSASTLNQELTYLAQAIDMARTLWGLNLQENAVRTTMRVMSQLKLIGGSNKRDRRLQDGEYIRLLRAAGTHWIGDTIRIAVHSSLRQEEIHQLHAEDMDWNNNVLRIRDREDARSKSGAFTTIPVHRPLKLALSRAMKYAKPGARLVPVKRSASISDRFALTAREAGIDGLTFHDLRHEAISRFFEKGLSIPEVAVISGHKTWGQLKRYTQLRPTDVLRTLE